MLGSRKVRGVARVTGLPVVWASVYSHHESGRLAYFTTADHQHGELDRLTGDWCLEEQPSCRSSCRMLFAEPGDIAARAERRRREIHNGGGPPRATPRLNDIAARAEQRRQEIHRLNKLT